LDQARAKDLCRNTSTDARVWQERFNSCLGKFEKSAFQRSLNGRRSLIGKVALSARQMIEQLQANPAVISQHIEQSERELFLAAAVVNISNVDSKAHPPICSVRGVHYLFERRRIVRTYCVSPISIRQHALERFAERGFAESDHAAWFLEKLVDVLPHLNTFGSLLTQMVRDGQLPQWSSLPIPIKEGVFICDFGPSRELDSFLQHTVQIGKHGVTECPNTTNNLICRAKTFLSWQTLSPYQNCVARELEANFANLEKLLPTLNLVLSGRGEMLATADELEALEEAKLKISDYIDIKRVSTAFSESDKTQH
jgi:hypothetical protein